jgi:Zn-dependent membrane protease YugP
MIRRYDDELPRGAMPKSERIAKETWFPAAVGAAALDSDALAAVAFGLFAFTVTVSFLTVWVEVDASRRALRELRALEVAALDQRGARRVLVACAATYVADTLFDLSFVGRRLRRDDDAAGGSSSGDVSGGFLRGLFD